MKNSAGIIPYRKNDDGKWEFFVGHPGGQHWNTRNLWMFLKGGVEDGESWGETALREFKEESGLLLENIKEDNLMPLGRVQQNPHKAAIAFGLYYPDIDIEKCHSNLADDGITPEIDKYAWMTYDELKEVTLPSHLQFYQQIIEMNEGFSDDYDSY